MLIGWMPLTCLLPANHLVGKSGSGLWLARLESQAPPQKGKRGASPSQAILTTLPQELSLLS